MLHMAGDPEMCGNYRTIALISHTSKILLYVILDRLKEKIEYELAEEQAGFRPSRGTSDMLCCIQIMIEKLLNVHKEAYIISIDYSKAFDSVCHQQLFETFKKNGISTSSRNPNAILIRRPRGQNQMERKTHRLFQYWQRRKARLYSITTLVQHVHGTNHERGGHRTFWY